MLRFFKMYVQASKRKYTCGSVYEHSIVGYRPKELVCVGSVEYYEFQLNPS